MLMLKRLLFVLTILLSAGVARADNLAKAIVKSVIDGDTIIVVTSAGKEEHLRLIGIDTPESRENDRAIRQAERNNEDLADILEQGQRAAKFAKSLVPPNSKVSIEYDTEKRDRYKRLLAYVWLPDGRMLNSVMLSEGYAYPLTVSPNVRYADEFLITFRQARKAGRGLWNKS